MCKDVHSSIVLVRTRFKNVDESHPKLKTLAVINMKESYRCSSIFLFAFVPILAVVGLVTRWLLLQPIHDQIVRKYQEQTALFYERHSICEIIDLQDFNLLTFPLACFLTLLFICLNKRASCLRLKLKGFIGPVIPLDFYIHIQRTFAVVVFAVVADEILDIINQVINGNTSNGEGK
jgi:hypothetical protein